MYAYMFPGRTTQASLVAQGGAAIKVGTRSPSQDFSQRQGQAAASKEMVSSWQQLGRPKFTGHLPKMASARFGVQSTVAGLGSNPVMGGSHKQ